MPPSDHFQDFTNRISISIVISIVITVVVFFKYACNINSLYRLCGSEFTCTFIFSLILNQIELSMIGRIQLKEPKNESEQESTVSNHLVITLSYFNIISIKYSDLVCVLWNKIEYHEDIFECNRIFRYWNVKDPHNESATYVSFTAISPLIRSF